ncbi:serine/threonine protein kinase [Elusimicrobiota bacterium]
MNIKQILAISLLILASISLALFLVTKNTKESARNELANKLLLIAKTSALLIDGDEHNKAIKNTQDYLKLKHKLQEITRANKQAKIKYIFTMKRTSDVNKWELTINTDESDLRAKPGDIYDVADLPEMQEAFNGPIADTKAYKDKWDEWLFSAYAPIRNKKGEPVAILGVDADAKDLIAFENSASRKLLLAMGFGMLIALPLGLISGWLINKKFSKKAKIDNIFETFLEAQACAKAQSPDDLQISHPHLSKELARKIAAYHQAERAIKTIQDFSSKEDPRPAKTFPEKTMGDFELIREIGSGGMAKIYLAEQLSLKRPVALKVLEPKNILNDKAIARFKREAQTVANLSHENIIPIHAFGENSGSYFIAMEYVCGLTLDRIIKSAQERSMPTLNAPFIEGLLDKNLEAVKQGSSQKWKDLFSVEQNKSFWRKGPIESICAIMSQIASALKLSHSLNIIHRDIKPSNIIIDLKGTARLLDFGLTKTQEPSELTQSTEFLGTIYYAAPEQMPGSYQNPAPQSDLYSLGVVLYEMLTLNRPFEGKTISDVAKNITTQAPPSPREFNPIIPQELEKLILKAIEKDPAKRHQNAEELMQDLKRWVQIWA